jgi:hypothetical protein
MEWGKGAIYQDSNKRWMTSWTVPEMEWVLTAHACFAKAVLSDPKLWLHQLSKKRHEEMPNPPNTTASVGGGGNNGKGNGAGGGKEAATGTAEEAAETEPEQAQQGATGGGAAVPEAGQPPNPRLGKYKKLKEVIGLKVVHR